MKQPAVFLLLSAAVLTATFQAAVARPAARSQAPVDFNREVRPILARNCFKCHGADENHRLAGLRLDRRDGAIAARTGLPGITPGAPAKSVALQRITAADPARRMPPASSGLRLSAADVGTLRRWIAEGAPYSEHWAWVAPKASVLPAVRRRDWPRNPVDHFTLARMEAAGMAPSPEADRFVLLRRASLDLRGLPPTPQEVDAFARDTTPQAYEHAVGRFLADPAFGERWARMWLDLARYADSAGYGSDPLRTIWKYRDWVIGAFNQDLPYDQFTREQLAGDLVPGATPAQRMATAFHRNTMTNTEGGTDDEEFRIAAVKDRVDTTLQVWMGVTGGCAKCHSHKYDPISQKDYYQFFAFFNQTADFDQPDERPTIPVEYAPLDALIREADAKIAALKARIEATRDPKAQQPLKDQLAQLEKSRPARATLPVMEELPTEKQRQTFLLVKGNFLERGEKVMPGTPSAFHALPPGAPVNRLGVAQWLTDPRNPLTARVAVNRFWAQLFGIGIVETEEDFGTQGAAPTHAELLDWLAVAFSGSTAVGRGSRGSGEQGHGSGARRAGSSAGDAGVPPLALNWSVKQLLRLLVTSATYRQSARVTTDQAAKDPQNRLYSRAPRFRLEAEMVRDQALALSGLLSNKIGGPSVYPPQPPGLWQAAFNGQRTWATSVGEDRYRRGLYTVWRRTVPYPSMAAFDAPSREICSVRRIRTNTPLQAFVTLNDPVFVEAAQAMARRILREGGDTPESRADYALRLVLTRPSQPAQRRHILALYEEQLSRYRSRSDDAKAFSTDPLGPLPAGLDAAEAAAWTVVANVLLNLDGVLTRG